MEGQTLHTTRIDLSIELDDVTEKPSLSEPTCDVVHNIGSLVGRASD